MSDSDQTHFGYKTVPSDEKAFLVGKVFHSVASKYDLMNDAMSFGLHRLWKQYTIQQAGLRKGQTVVDVAAGTGDLTKAFAKAVGPTGKVIMTDINQSMLEKGRDRLTNEGIIGNVDFVEADAESLPFPNAFADRVSISFGLRNVTHQAKALAEFYRILKPGGKCLILEFSKVSHPLLSKLYDTYSFNVIPKLGKLLANDEASYQYLVESIRMHPDQDTLKQMMESVGFEDVSYHNLCGGIVALHIGYHY